MERNARDVLIGENFRRKDYSIVYTRCAFEGLSIQIYRCVENIVAIASGSVWCIPCNETVEIVE